jgi:hypothetical protein
MKKLLTALAITAGLFATQAMAQSAFNGAFGQVGIGYENTAPGQGLRSRRNGKVLEDTFEIFEIGWHGLWGWVQCFVLFVQLESDQFA